MAMQASAIQQKVSRMLSGKNGRPVLKPPRALTLKDEVANRKLKKGEATCITEMSQLMTCWKKNNFDNAVCSKEVTGFYSCIRRAQADMKAQTKQRGTSQTGRLLPREVTTMLKRHPNLGTEI